MRKKINDQNEINPYKAKINHNINYTNNSINKNQKKFSNCFSSTISNKKVKIIKIGQKKYTKDLNENLNRIKIPKGLNRSVNSNKKRKILPIQLIEKYIYIKLKII